MEVQITSKNGLRKGAVVAVTLRVANCFCELQRSTGNDDDDEV
jgi:hypothetical protein